MNKGLLFLLPWLCWCVVTNTYAQQTTAKKLAPIRSVSVTGGVNIPGTYPISKPTSLIELIAKAGGPTKYANTKNIQITHADGRMVNFNLELYSRNPNKQTLPLLYPGDSVFLPDRTIKQTRVWLTAQRNQTVQLMGAIAQPGRYDWAEDYTLLDIIAQAGGPTARADIAHIKILAEPKDGRMKKPQIFNLEQFINEGGDLNRLPKVKAGYTVLVPQLTDDFNAGNLAGWVRQPPSQSIYLFGEVTSPGRYAFNNSMGFLDILSAANGPNNNADINDIRVLHRNGKRPEVSHVNLGLYFRTGDSSLLPSVMPEDAIYIPGIQGGVWNNQDPRQRIRVLGAVGTPGRYTFSDGMNIIDVLTEAGGPTAEALFDSVLVVHPNSKDRQAVRFDMQAYSKSGDPKLLPMLRPGDIVYVPFERQGNWRRLMDKLQDVSAILVILRVAGVIS